MPCGTETVATPVARLDTALFGTVRTFLAVAMTMLTRARAPVVSAADGFVTVTTTGYVGVEPVVDDVGSKPIEVTFPVTDAVAPSAVTCAD